jgi:hypothetical protein
MDSTIKKPLSQLLWDAFSYFQEKYGNNKQYETWTQSSDKCAAVHLTIEGFPSWARPGLLLRRYGDDEHTPTLFLNLTMPDPEFNEDFHGSVMEVHCSFGDTAMLWSTPLEGLGGISRVFHYKEEDKAKADLQLEFNTKIHELFFSGMYDTSQKKISAVLAV